ncbi:MAG TPA: pitrilysin family protein [Microlunatus sp.]|nr:pitrilysin family protein [Microlunatus sp.]
MTVLPTTPPPIAAPPPWSFPAVQRHTLGNGIELHAYHLPGQHIIAAHLALDVPLSAEPANLEGVATITTRCLDEGTRAHAGEEYAELLETEGAGFGVEIGLSGLQAVLDVPVRRVDRAFALFAEAVTDPALAAEDVARHVKLRLAEIEQSRANSASRASTEFRRAVYAADSRAARMNGGEPDTVANVAAGDAVDFHRRWYGPSGTSLVVAGDLSGVDVVALAERTFGGWRNDEQQRTSPEPVGPAPATAVLVDRPDAVQADLRLGGFAADRNDPRWADLTVAGYAMGGAFLSRLNKVLREERGYTYGVRLGFTPLRQGGSYAVSGSFRTEVLVDAVREARELMTVTERPFVPDEVSDAVAYYVGTSPLRFATADGVAGQAATQIQAGLSPDYLDESLAALRQVTPESATSAYASVVDVGAASLVVVGAADQLAEPLRALGYDDLVVVDA